MKWLKSEELYDQSILQAEDIAYVEVYPREKSTGIPNEVAFERMKEDNIKPLKMEDTEKIKQVLQANSNWQNGSYLVGLYFNEAEPRVNAVLGFSEEEAPSFITDYFDGRE